MGFGGIAPDVSTEVNALLGNSVFQIPQSSATPIEQVQANQISHPSSQSDPVEISSTALELSNKSKNSKG